MAIKNNREHKEPQTSHYGEIHSRAYRVHVLHFLNVTDMVAML